MDISMIKIQSFAQKYIREFLHNNGFVEIHSPKISEIAADQLDHLFSVTFYGKQAYLLPGPQTYKQVAVLSGLKKVFEIAPAYRGEPREDKRHLSEYISIDVESSSFNNISDVMDFEEELLCLIVNRLAENNETKEFIDRRLTSVIPFPRIAYSAAIEILEKKLQRIICFGSKISGTYEELLSSILEKELGAISYFLTHFPSRDRDFYYRDNQSHPEISDSFDLIFGKWEVSSGGMRETNYQRLVNKLKNVGTDLDMLDFFLKMFRKNSVASHGGFAIGLERLTGSLRRDYDITRNTLHVRNLKNLRDR